MLHFDRLVRMVLASNHIVSSNNLSFVLHNLYQVLQRLLSVLCVSNSNKHRLATCMTKHPGSYRRVHNLHSRHLHLYRYTLVLHNMAYLRNMNLSKSCLHNHAVRHMPKHKVLHRIQMMNNHSSRYTLYLNIYKHLPPTFSMYTQLLKL